MIAPETALATLKAYSNPEKAGQMAAYHKVEREYLGVSNPQIDACCKEWRANCDVAERLAISQHLWVSNIHEARIAAAKLLTQARIKDDGLVWDEITSWVPQFDAWAIADHACSAGARRLSANPARLNEVEGWTKDDSLWVRRAALVITLPWTKSNHPKPAELEQRDRILGWAASYVPDQQWFIQKAISWWLRSLSKHDPDRVRAFVEKYGDGMRAFARKDATKYL